MRLTPGIMTILTLVGGGLLTQAGAWAQRRWQVVDGAATREALRKAELEDRRQQRIDQACERILDTIIEVAALVQQAGWTSVPDEVLRLALVISREATFLPDVELRKRVENAAGLLWWGDVVAAQVSMSAAAVVQDASAEIGDVIGAILRREAAPSVTSTVADLLKQHRTIVAQQRKSDGGPART